MNRLCSECGNKLTFKNTFFVERLFHPDKRRACKTCYKKITGHNDKDIILLDSLFGKEDNEI